MLKALCCLQPNGRFLFLMLDGRWTERNAGRLRTYDTMDGAQRGIRRFGATAPYRPVMVKLLDANDTDAAAPSTHIQNRDVRPGDVLVDAIGRPYFRVDAVHPARARGYVVFTGQSLQHRDGARTAGGHREDMVTVQRPDGRTS